MGLSTLVPGGQDARDFALYAVDLARDWLQSPAAWSQLALLVLVYAVAAVAVRRLAAGWRPLKAKPARWRKYAALFWCFYRCFCRCWPMH